MELAKVFKFTEADLHANKNGLLSADQQKRYAEFQQMTNHTTHCVWRVAGSMLILQGGLFLWLILNTLQENGRQDQLIVFMFMLGIIMLIFLYIFISGYLQQRRNNRNIGSQRIHMIEGPVSPIYVDEAVHGIEVYKTTIIPYDGILSRKVMDIIEPHTVYRVFYIPVSNGNVLLSLEKA